MTNRWSCSPGWSWFGGRSEAGGDLNKRRFTGDLVLEYYAAPKMDAVPEAYTERFRDLNATICGDGERQQRLLLHHRRLAQQEDGDPARRPPGGETETFRLASGAGAPPVVPCAIEKRGNRVSLWVNNPVVGALIPDKPLLSWKTPTRCRGSDCL